MSDDARRIFEAAMQLPDAERAPPSTTTEDPPAPAQAPKKWAPRGTGMAIAGGSMAVVGLGFGLIGGIGWWWWSECNQICPSEEGRVRNGFLIAGGSLALVGLSLAVSGLVLAKQSRRPQTVMVTPLVGPRMTGLGLAARF